MSVVNLRRYSLKGGLVKGSEFADIPGASPVVNYISASGGDMYITGSFVYHVFTGSAVPLNVFTPGTGELLVVAGGGNGVAGGGGAGGAVYSGSFSYVSGAYSVTIGAGGAAAGNGDGTSNNGNNSSFGSVTATAGGGGGRESATNGGNGGSGGGAGGGQPGTGTLGQGNDGGVGWGTGAPSPTCYYRGGGGGASQDGNQTNGSGASGKGGDGFSSSFSIIPFGDSSFRGWFAGGGGGGFSDANLCSLSPAGGPGGRGGGGAGSTSIGAAATAGQANTGGGGGGTRASTSGAGGSGIVIVKYPLDPARTISTANLAIWYDAQNPTSNPGSGTTWFSLTGSINGTLTNGAAFAGTNPEYVALDGTNDFVDIGDFFDPIGAFTMQGWFYSTNISVKKIFASKWNDTGNNRTILFGHTIDSGRGPSLILDRSGTFGTILKVDTATQLSTNTWYHLAATYDGNNAAIYRDGVAIATGAFGSTANLYSGTAPLVIGNESGTSNYFAGRVGEFDYYTAALDAQTIRNNYNLTKTQYGFS